VVWSFTPGGGLGGLARGYYHAASPRLRKGEPLGAGDAGLGLVFISALAARRARPRALIWAAG
jgi:hypothetical protein